MQKINANIFSHQSQNRLSDLVAEHLDHLHYLNDILCLNIADLNEVLTEHLLHKLLIPLYICSLKSMRKESETSIETATQNLAKVLNRNLNLGDGANLQFEATNSKVSCVVALFLLSQVFLIISHPPLIHTLAWIILKTDKKMLENGMDRLLEQYDKEVREEPEKNDVGDECASNYNPSTSSADVVDHKNITDEEKQRLVTHAQVPQTDLAFLKNKPFLETIFNALDCGENDYTALFALCLLFALVNNKGNVKK